MTLLLLLACGGTPTPEPVAPAPAVPAAPPPAAAFTCCSDAALASVVETYAAGSAALAADRDGSLEANTLLERTMAARGVPGLASSTADALVRLEGAARDASAAADTKARRAAWKAVSAIVVPLARGAGGGTVAYREAWCPMAEAAWLQPASASTIANPYYGSEMLTCGVFR